MKFGTFILLLFIFASCASSKQASFLRNVQKSSCNQENSYKYTKADIPRPLYQITIDSAIASHFNYKDLNIANAIGVLDLLTDYVKEKALISKDSSLQNQIDMIHIGQELNHRIDLASLEISSVSAELDCEEERIDQIAGYLSEKEKKKETNLTVGSIILGSLSAITTGVLVAKKDESNFSDYMGVGVGVADATFGILMLTSNRKITLEHKRNVLREIWFGSDTSTVYPPSIWYYLNTANPAKNEISLRQQLINNWMNFGQVKDIRGRKKNKAPNIEIYFGEGGKYTIDELENRANMYDQIESMIKLMKQDLRNLSLSIGKLH